MCGIAGIVYGHGRSVDARATLNRLRHRGPDGSGQVDISVGDSKVWMGHTRLAIQDLTEAGATDLLEIPISKIVH